MNKVVRFSACVMLVSLLVACSTQQTRTKSSIMDYLYPKDSNVTVQPSIPHLNVPVKVGIAFVPEQSTRHRGINMWGSGNDIYSLTETDKSMLLEEVANNFRKRDFVGEIEVIPSAYLTEGGGFENLDQIKTMYGIDIIALVSYDQVQFTDEGMLSLTYWTIVGAYVISGQKNDTSTMLDTAVYDIKSRKMLFRAPGTSKIKGRSTPVNLSEELRADSLNGFKEASAMMTSNLDLELDKFKEKIKSKPEAVKVTYQEGYSAGGALGYFGLLVLLMSGVAYRYKSNK